MIAGGSAVDQRLLLFWDGAKYHHSEELREFLQQINGSMYSTTAQHSACRLLGNKTENDISYRKIL